MPGKLDWGPISENQLENANLVLSVTKEFTFDAAHSLPGYNGPCENLHGHTYRLQVTVQRRDGWKEIDALGSCHGMVMDFGLLSAVVKDSIVSALDHSNLNEVLPFRTTAENMASWIFNSLSGRMQGAGIVVTEVKLWETPTSYATARLASS